MLGCAIVSLAVPGLACFGPGLAWALLGLCLGWPDDTPVRPGLTWPWLGLGMGWAWLGMGSAGAGPVLARAEAALGRVWFSAGVA